MAGVSHRPILASVDLPALTLRMARDQKGCLFRARGWTDDACHSLAGVRTEDRPAAGNGNTTATVGSQVRSTVTIQGIDHATHAVTVAGPDNNARTVGVHDPNARRFVSKLKVGDKVDMVYTASVAVDLEPQS